ncbi:MAG: amidase [Deltaproteobacteria bacterium]|nr:amidase [Deltaproteobacteria bacterium]
MNSLLTLSATRLAEMIKSGEVTSREVVGAHIARIEEVNPTLNAMVRTRFDEARTEADAADRILRQNGRDGLPTFHGVPCSIKECFALTGMPNTGGLVARKDVVSNEDATAVKRLRKAGAIPLGVTNLSELCMWMESDNRVYGRTNNPYDPTRIVGGSSGGEGAIIGSGGTPFGLGSDIGGSIRMPAFFNGVFGHKPSGGLVPNTGQFPISHGKARRYLTTGPLCRRAEDLWPLVKTLAGPDEIEEQCTPLPLGDPASVRIEGLNVLVVEDNGRRPVSGELKATLHRAARALAERGAKVKEAVYPALGHAFDIWSTMLTKAGGPSFGTLLGNGRQVNTYWEVARCLAGRSEHTLPAVGLALLEHLAPLVLGDTERWVRMGEELKHDLTRDIGPDGVMLYPPYPSTAPRHHRPLLTPLQGVYTSIMNIMEFPVTQVPAGLSNDGLPLGLQVVSMHGNDHVTVAVAMELEKALGGWTPPPLAI